jgi:hypothetical protein
MAHSLPRYMYMSVVGRCAVSRQFTCSPIKIKTTPCGISVACSKTGGASNVWARHVQVIEAVPCAIHAVIGEDLLSCLV